MSCSIFVLAFLTMGRSPGSSDSKKNKKTKTHPQCRRPGFNPRVGKIPWKGEWLPTLVFLPGEFHGLYSPQGNKKSDTTEWISHFSFSLTIPFLTSPFIKLFVVKHFGVHHLFPAKTLPTTTGACQGHVPSASGAIESRAAAAAHPRHALERSSGWRLRFSVCQGNWWNRSLDG